VNIGLKTGTGEDVPFQRI